MAADPNWPSSVRHLIAQRRVVAQIEVALDAAQQDGQKFENGLLVGPSGLGKTSAARVIAREMAGRFHEVLGQSITQAAALNELLLRAEDRDVVFIDECHELPVQLQTRLYQTLDRRCISVDVGGAPISLPVANFTLLLATTDEYALLPPLRERMSLVLRFEFYSDSDLCTILDLHSRAAGWEVANGVFPEVARRSGGTPRIALRLMKAGHRVARSLGAVIVGPEHLMRALDMEQIDERGLGPNEQTYLKLVGRGQNQLNVIAAAMGLPTQTVSRVIEPILIRAGLITKGPNSTRSLTNAATPRTDEGNHDDALCD